MGILVSLLHFSKSSDMMSTGKSTTVIGPIENVNLLLSENQTVVQQKNVLNFYSSFLLKIN